MEEHRLRVFENRVLSRIFGPKREKWREAGENCIMRTFTKCHKGDQGKEDEMDGACSTHGRDEKCIRYFDWKT